MRRSPRPTSTPFRIMAARGARRLGSRLRARAAGHSERDPGGVQSSARDAAGVQLNRGRLACVMTLLASAITLTFACCPYAHAGPIIDRIKSSGVIRCGGVPRPGLVGQSPGGAASGLYLDLCRAIARRCLGPKAGSSSTLMIPTKPSRASLTARTISSSSTARTSAIIGSRAPQRSGPPSISSRPPQWSTGQRRSSD
jgi:hypothetical protein